MALSASDAQPNPTGCRQPWGPCNRIAGRRLICPDRNGMFGRRKYQHVEVLSHETGYESNCDPKQAKQEALSMNQMRHGCAGDRSEWIPRIFWPEPPRFPIKESSRWISMQFRSQTRGILTLTSTTTEARASGRQQRAGNQIASS